MAFGRGRLKASAGRVCDEEKTVDRATINKRIDPAAAGCMRKLLGEMACSFLK